MKMITKISLIGGLLASSIAFAGAQADTGSKKASQECHHGSHSKMKGQNVDREGKFLDRMTERLKLTTEQRGSVQAVLQKSKSQRVALKEKMRSNRKALRALGQDGKIDDNKVQELARERGNLVADLVIQRSKVRSEIQQVLTDTQREQMKQMREQHGHHNKG
jgi:Spy/CpxP family protein refolding chaperone